MFTHILGSRTSIFPNTYCKCKNQTCNTTHFYSTTKQKNNKKKPKQPNQTNPKPKINPKTLQEIKICPNKRKTQRQLENLNLFSCVLEQRSLIKTQIGDIFYFTSSEGWTQECSQKWAGSLTDLTIKDLLEPHSHKIKQDTQVIQC